MLVFLVFATTGIFTACKKSNDQKKACKILDASINGGSDIFISYNNDGRISQASVGIRSIYTFSYKGDTVIVLNTDSGVFQSRTIYANNSAGLATWQRTEYDKEGTNWNVVKYEYNGEELSKATSTNSSGGSPTVNTYTWFDHNMVSQVSGSNTILYDYYTDKPIQSGDYFSFTQLIQGAEMIRNKNLIKSVTGSTLNYAFDSDGNISSLEIVGANSVSVLNYNYQCY